MGLTAKQHMTAGGEVELLLITPIRSGIMGVHRGAKRAFPMEIGPKN